MSADPRRQAALTALVAVARGRDLESALHRARGHDPAAGPLIEELVRGTLQWWSRYHHLVVHFSRRRATTNPVVLAVLHLAMHELLTHRSVPAYATLHQAGELLRGAGQPGAVGYVNAVLQSLQRQVTAAAPAEPLDAVRSLFVRPDDPVDELATWWSHPRWLVERWRARYGHEDTSALLAHACIPPLITLHVLPGGDRDQEQEGLEAAGLSSEPVAGFERALRLKTRCDRATLAAALATRPKLLVQDAAAQAVVDWLTADGDDLRSTGGPVVDLCAAPGGKAAHLRTLMPQENLLIAMDRSWRRLRRVRRNRSRLGLDTMRLLVGDGLAPPLKDGTCAVILLDGPCSGTGVGRHHPEGRWRLSEQAIRESGARLLQLATRSARLLREGGRLYYATCSLEPEENEEVTAALVAGANDLEPDPDSAGCWQRTWLPWQHGSDGFFAARLRRGVGKDG